MAPTLTPASYAEFVSKLLSSQPHIGPGAQRDRLQLLTTLVNVLPQDGLGVLPELVSEAVLGTKEVNEKARDAGFELVVEMGKKMAKGGKVNRAEGEEDGEVENTSVDASAEEYLTMVAAGLTGTTPHMISASINALSRLLFEFKDQVSDQTISELLSTLTIFLTSKNREIVKSALGFAKVTIVSLPIATLRPHLPQLVPALLGWVHDHKNHFKSKTIHIFERLIRRFGFDEVYANAGEKVEEKKVLIGIRKRKERAKKKRAGKGDEEEGDKRQSMGNAFDDILYNSDSDLSSDEDEDAPAKGRTQAQGKGQVKGKRAQQQQQQQQQQQRERREKGGDVYIRNDEDEPMDLLSRSIAGGVSTNNPALQAPRRKPGQLASKFQTDKSGKLIITDDNSADEADPSASAGAAFMANVANTTADGTYRDSRGNLKFNRNTKRAREAEGDILRGLDEEDAKKENKLRERKKMRKQLGEEFRAKRAGGDIKREGGPDPYSYVPLGQTGGKKGKKGNFNLTNKKKGSRG